MRPTECSWELESVTHSDACDAVAEDLVTQYLEELNRSMDTVIVRARTHTHTHTHTESLTLRCLILLAHTAIYVS